MAIWGRGPTLPQSGDQKNELTMGKLTADRRVTNQVLGMMIPTSKYGITLPETNIAHENPNVSL